MPTFQEHKEIRELFEFTEKELQRFKERIYVWELTVLFYRLVHLIEQFRANLIIDYTKLSKKIVNRSGTIISLNKNVLALDSGTHAKTKEFLDELVSKNVISQNFVDKYQVFNTASRHARYKSSDKFIRTYILNTGCIKCGHKKGKYAQNSEYGSIICTKCKEKQLPPPNCDFMVLKTKYSEMEEYLKETFSDYNL